MPILTLLTDFGQADTYVGQVKGAILSVAPSTSIVDLTHAVAAQDVFGGAFRLWTAVEVFPAGTIHLAVVDPGVGSARRGVALRARRGDVFVGPDNGLLMPAVGRLGGCEMAVELSRAAFWRGGAGSGATATFHGRDVFGPAAGHLAAGVSLDALGPRIADPVGLELPAPRGRVGEILDVDAYGNLVTNLPASLAGEGARVTSGVALRVGDRLAHAAAYYAAVEPGALLAIVGSSGLWEIAARDANAAAITGARRGTAVRIEVGSGGP